LHRIEVGHPDPTLVVLAWPTSRPCTATAVAILIALDQFPRSETLMKPLVTTIPLVLLAAVSAASAQPKDPVDYVDTSIGTISHMLVPTFPTIQRPNGMLRIVPTRASPPIASAGSASASPRTGRGRSFS
jgi:hypothetical protein